MVATDDVTVIEVNQHATARSQVDHSPAVSQKPRISIDGPSELVVASKVSMRRF